MDFSLTDDQALLRDTARDLFTTECPAALVRAHMNDPSVVVPLWQRHLREWALLGDDSLVGHCLFLEEAGAVVLPGVYFTTSALFLPVMRAIGNPLADGVVAGDVTGTVSMAGRSGLWEINDDRTHTFVLEADRVDYVAFVQPGPSIAVVDAAAVSARPIETLDSTRRTFSLEVPDNLDATPIDPTVLEDVVARATVALSAELVGVSRWLLDRSVSYAKDRVQFGRPIGSFQGLQWELVSMALDHECAAAAVAYAAMAFDAGDDDRYRATHVAKASAGTAARHSARGGMQVHGGIGYTWEHDLHLYLRRAFASDALLGPAGWHYDRLADLQLP